MKQIGWFVIGEGKFGKRTFGETFLNLEEDRCYWWDRGYDLVACFVAEE